jgi:hypothetical protein
VTAAALLDRLERVKQTAPGRWLARCPAHEDRSPSLSIRELDDGRVLLNDFGGCPTSDVLAALGLSMGDLFPRDLPAVQSGTGYPRTHSRIPARDLLDALSLEATAVSLIAHRIADTRQITSEDIERLRTAARRINAARDLANAN